MVGRGIIPSARFRALSAFARRSSRCSDDPAVPKSSCRKRNPLLHPSTSRVRFSFACSSRPVPPERQSLPVTPAGPASDEPRDTLHAKRVPSSSRRAGGVMMRQLCRVLVGACAVLGFPALAIAQQSTTITGRVTSEGGVPLESAQVYLEGMSLGGLTQADGSYSITVPADRATGQQATLTARLIGYKQASARITLAAGNITHDFQL